MRSSVLMLTTAFFLPSAGFADAIHPTCESLERIMTGDLPADMTDQRDRLVGVVYDNEPAACHSELTTVRGHWKQLAFADELVEPQGTDRG